LLFLVGFGSQKSNIIIVNKKRYYIYVILEYYFKTRKVIIIIIIIIFTVNIIIKYTSKYKMSTDRECFGSLTSQNLLWRSFCVIMRLLLMVVK
jgi:hypothetical protein